MIESLNRNSQRLMGITSIRSVTFAAMSDDIQKKQGSSSSTAAKPHLTHTASGSPLPPTNGTSQPHTSIGGTTTSDKVKEKGKEREKDSLEKPSNVFKVSLVPAVHLD
jgi:hypothetical protein